MKEVRDKAVRSEERTGDAQYTELSSTKTPEISSQLIIHSASYGAQGMFNDVTELLKTKIVMNKLEIIVNNTNFGPDPIKGVKKDLIVEYSYDDKRDKIIVQEDFPLVLPS